MPAHSERELAAVQAALQRWDMLLVTDRQLPAVTTIVAGEPVRGSWWGHAKGHAIYDLLRVLYDDPDVFPVKLVHGKITLVRRPLFAALRAVAEADDPWQTDGLSPLALWMRDAVAREGRVRVDALSPPARLEGDTKKAARELEQRLLVAAGQIHTESGHHVRVLEPLADAFDRAGAPRGAMTPQQGRLRSVGAEWAIETGAATRFPWMSRRA